MQRQRAVSIIAAIMRNVEMDTARAQALRRGIPAPLAEVGEALRLALDELEPAAIREEERCPYCRIVIYRWEDESDLTHEQWCPRKLRLDALQSQSDGGKGYVAPDTSTASTKAPE